MYESLELLPSVLKEILFFFIFSPYFQDFNKNMTIDILTRVYLKSPISLLFSIEVAGVSRFTF